MTKYTANCLQPPLFGLIEITLTKNQIAIVDSIDIDLLAYKWHAQKSKYTFYAYRRDYRLEPEHGKLISMHRMILQRILDRPMDKGEYTDHIDGNGLNNSRVNLRLANINQNNSNKRMQRNNTSGYKGVNFFKPALKWRATIKVDGEQIALGYYDTKEEAYAAYCEAAKRFYGEFARLE